MLNFFKAYAQKYEQNKNLCILQFFHLRKLNILSQVTTVNFKF